MRFKPCLDQVNSEGLPRGRRSPDGGGPHTGSRWAGSMHACADARVSE